MHVPNSGLMAGAVLALALLTSAPLAATAKATAHAGTQCPTGHALHKLAANTSNPVIEFGIKGGNIRPWSVTISGDGSISTPGWVTVSNKHLTNPKDALAGLASLATAEGFFSLPATTQCRGSLPDVASDYITLTTTAGAKSVSVHGACKAKFRQLWAVINSVAGVAP